jgi:hypothetical protein
MGHAQEKIISVGGGGGCKQVHAHINTKCKDLVFCNSKLFQFNAQKCNPQSYKGKFLDILSFTKRRNQPILAVIHDFKLSLSTMKLQFRHSSAEDAVRIRQSVRNSDGTHFPDKYMHTTSLEC